MSQMPSSRLPMQYPVIYEEKPEEDWQFFAEAIQAWRSWNVVEYDGVLLLQSVTYKTFWIPKQEMIAKCLVGLNLNNRPHRGPHGAPDVEHGCGIYSVKSRELINEWMTPPFASGKILVYGTVSIWGNVFEFTRGYLSEFAYPSNLMVPESEKMKEIGIDRIELAHELSATYQVEAKPI